MTACTPTNVVLNGTASLGATVTPQHPNPTYDCPEVGASAAALAAAFHEDTNPNPNADNAVRQQPRGGSNGGGGPTVAHRTVLVDSFSAQIGPAASIVPQGRAGL